MLVTTSHKVDIFLKQPFFWMLLLLLFASGCDSCFNRQHRGIELYQPSDAVSGRTQSPSGSLGTPSQTPLTPHITSSPESPNSAPDIPTEYEIAVEKIRRIENGMSYAEITQIIGEPGGLIAGNDSASGVYQWHLAGMGFMGRFEKDILVRSNLFRYKASPKSGNISPVFEYTQELYDSIRPGMQYEEVYGLIGTNPESLTDNSSPVSIYKWRDSRGSSIIGRFENGVLTRKSGEIKDIETTAQESAPIQESAIPDVPYSSPITETETVDIEMQENAPAEEPQNDTQKREIFTTPPERQVHIAGESRRDRELETSTNPYAGRSYKPVAKLPDYTRRIRRGDFEIRVQNDAEVQMSVAIIAEDNGIDMTIGSGSTASFFVGRGIYDLYYIYDNDPFTLYQGQQLPVDITLADYIVTIYDDSYSVNYLDRNLEPSAPSRR